MSGKRLALGFVAVCLGLAALGIMVLTGCGTIVNLNAPTPEPGRSILWQESVVKPYGGVLQDGKSGFDIVNTGSVYALFAPYVLFVDLPLSFVGDTLTLPYVFYRLAWPDPPFVPPTDKQPEDEAANQPAEKATVADTLTPPYVNCPLAGRDPPFVPPTDKQPDVKASPSAPEGR